MHEVTPDGAVYFGADADPGNTDESSKYPSAVALVWRWTGDEAFLPTCTPGQQAGDGVRRGLDEDEDGWPRVSATSSVPAWVRRSWTTPSTPSAATPTWPTWPPRSATTRPGLGGRQGPGLLEKFEETWWYGGDTHSYADSLEDPGNEKVFQRHWIGLTPTDAVLPRIPGRAAGPLASRAHASTTLNEHEQSCYTGTLGLFHTGTGPTSAPAGNPGPSCDSVVSAVPSERNVFTLNSAIAAVSEGNYGRLGA